METFMVFTQETSNKNDTTLEQSLIQANCQEWNENICQY